MYMYSFLICAAALIASYFIYGKAIERIAGVDESVETPVHRLEDGVDYIPMPRWKLYLVHFLNIAGLGPIFGAIQGALFGPAAFSSERSMTSSQDSCPFEATDSQCLKSSQSILEPEPGSLWASSS